MNLFDSDGGQGEDSSGNSLADSFYEQMLLPLHARALQRLTDLELRAQNDRLFMRLRSLREAPIGCQLYFWGSPGSGRTSVLKGLCEHFFADDQPLAVLDCAVGQEELSASLKALPSARLICLDNLERIIHWPGVQQLLMEQWRRSIGVEGPCHFVFVGSVPLSKLQLSMDLTSRLRQGEQYRLIKLGDEQRKRALTRRAAEQGVNLEPAVAAYLVRHSTRNLGRNMQLLEKALKLSQTEQKSVTVALVRRLLQREMF